MNIEELENLMDKFYDINMDVDEEVFEKILEFSKVDKNEFIRYVNAQKFGSESYRPILYEALMVEANGWEEFLLDQIVLIIEESELGNKEAEEVIFSIYYLTNIRDLETNFYLETIAYFESKLKSSNPHVKRAALEYIIDLHSDGNLSLEPTLQKKLQEQLYDQEYKTRLSALVNLEEDNLLPPGFNQPVMDKIRTYFNSEHRQLMKHKEIGKNVADQIMKNDP